MQKKRTMLAMFLYLLIFLSLLGTIQLADRVFDPVSTERRIGAGESTSVFGAMISDVATAMPVWAYAVIFIILAVGIRIGLHRYYYQSYAKSRENLMARDSYTHVRQYQKEDVQFSLDQFAEMVGQKQEFLQRCALKKEFVEARPYVSKELFGELGCKEKGLTMDLLQIKLDGFRQTDSEDVMAVLLTCASRKGFARGEYEWLFMRERGKTTQFSEGESILNYGNWCLTSIKQIG